jgi:tRNA1Val (adenine37-N6)-methyltransferase
VSSVEHTSGHLLGGRVRYCQPRQGFRTGVEPVLLAACLPVEPGERVLEGGTGAGATLLCLAARIAGVTAVGVDRDPVLVSLARRNAAANGWLSLDFAVAEMAALPETGIFDHVCANPPFHQARSTPSPDLARESAKRDQGGVFQLWARALAERLRPRGTLTFILSAGSLPKCADAFAVAGCRPTAMLPLWPKAGREAKLVLLRGVKDSRTPFRVLPGLVLHEADGGFTQKAQAILRQGQGLSL